MAAVTASPPPSTTSSANNSPIRRKPVPLHDLTTGSHGSPQSGKPLPTAPVPGSPRLGNTPRSPVKVNFQPEDWAQPSNANIETHVSYAKAVPPIDRDLPKTPEAPTPPPHTPLLERTEGAASQPQHDTMRIVPNITASYVSDKPLPSVGLGVEQTLQPSGIVSPEPDDLSVSDKSRTQDVNRLSRESDATTSTSQKPASTESSATTSASSVSGINETSDCQEADVSPESSVIEEQSQMVPQLQYHHQAFLPRASTAPIEQDPRAHSTSELAENAASINRLLTPSFQRRSSLQRPQSAYSAYSDFGPRGRSPGLGHARTPSSQARRSPDHRPSSYAELLNVPYPQPAPAPLPIDNSLLRNAVGSNASLLSTQKTLEMYRQNVKKTNDLSIQYSFAVFLISTAQEMGLNFNDLSKPRHSSKEDRDSPYSEPASLSPHELVREARTILQKLSNSGYPFAQYYLADGYASGLFSKGKEDYNSAFPLFVLAAKHGHAESAYRTALCYEFGWGCRKDAAKAVQFLRTAASKRHPGAMTRLGKACLSGDLGEKRYREGIKWLKLATEAADTIYNAAPYHLGCLYETGYGDDIFQDESYAAELFTQAADLGHPEANYRMGDAYEHGKLNCPRDPALSVHFYTGAAERGHAAAMMGLCAWYMVGAEPILEKDEEEAYEWARRSAELGYVKAQYAVGYFTEMGIGCRRDILEANVWYVKAADAGDERAQQRLAAIRAAISGGTPMEVGPPRNGHHKVKKAHGEKDDKECIVM
ncbi:HCP-like protein [Coniochaeta sp. PMI_546]|nr:HCP-like protein [Coniochaeta sp. PMI_546]